MAQLVSNHVYTTNSGINPVETPGNVIDINATGGVTTFPAGNNPYVVALSTDGTKLAVGSIDQIDNYANPAVYIFNTANDSLIATLSLSAGYQQAPYAMSFNPSGTALYVVNNNWGNGYLGGTLVHIKTSNWTVQDTISIRPYATDIAFLPDGSMAYIPEDHGDVAVIQTSNDSIVTRISLGPLGPNGATIGGPPGGPNPLYVTAYDEADGTGGSIVVINTALNTVATTISTPANEIYMVQKGSTLYADTGSYGDGTGLYAINETTGLVTGSNLTAITAPECLALSSDGSRLYQANFFNITVYGLPGLAIQGTITPPNMNSGSIAAN